MSATTPSPTTSPQAPAPSSTQASGGIMPSLYPLRIGPVHTAYYQQHFDRFEALGRATPTWNFSAACFTLAWLLLRQMYRPAMMYAGGLLTFVLLWWFGLHGQVSALLEAGFLAVGALLLCVLPGLMGNALYYHHVRHQTLAALRGSPSVAHAQRKLRDKPVTKDHLNVAIAAQTVASLVVVALLLSQTNWADLRLGAQAPVTASGPPDLLIPSVADLGAAPPPPELPSLTPDMAWPGAQTVIEPQTTTPAQQPEALQASELSVVQLAQSLTPAPATADAAAATAPVTAPVTAPPPTPAPIALSAPAKVAATTQAPAPQAASVATPAAPKPAPTPTAKPVTAPLPAAAVARPASGMVPGKFYLNAGVYAQAANVDRAVQSLQGAKLPVLRQGVSSNKGDLTRLRIGPFDTRAQADAAAAKAKQLRFEVNVFQQPLK